MRIHFCEGTYVEIYAPEGSYLVVQFGDGVIHVLQKPNDNSFAYTRLTANTDKILFIDYCNDGKDKEGYEKLPIEVFHK